MHGGRFAIFACSIPLITGCTSIALRNSTDAAASQIATIIEQQIGENLGRFHADRFAMPSQMVLGQGAITVQNNVSATLKAPYTLTQKSSKEGDAGTTMQWQESWTVTPVVDPVDLQHLQFVYACAVKECPKEETYVKRPEPKPAAAEKAGAAPAAAGPSSEVVTQFFRDHPPGGGWHSGPRRVKTVGGRSAGTRALRSGCNRKAFLNSFSW